MLVTALHLAILSATDNDGSQNATSQQTSDELETAECDGNSNRFGIAPRPLEVTVGHFVVTALDILPPMLTDSHVTERRDSWLWLFTSALTEHSWTEQRLAVVALKYSDGII